MRRIDKMMQQIEQIKRTMAPVFFSAFVEAVKAGWVVVCYLKYENRCEKIVAFRPDMESVQRHLEDMRRKYPGADDPTVIIDNLPRGG